MNARRAAASSTISVTGLAAIAVVLVHVVTVGPPLVGLTVAALGAAVGLAVVALGYLVYRFEFTVRQTVRIAAWNLLGVVVIALALALIYAYHSALGSPPPAAVFSGTVLVAISSLAHVLIGINDARRIRAGALERERRKLSVLSRLVRHDLRTISQYLYGDASRARAADTQEERDAVADDIAETAADLGGLHDNLQTLRELVETVGANAAPVDVTDLVADAVVGVREDYPDADIDVDVPESASATAGEYVTDAVQELVENAIEHTDGAVEVVVTREDGWVTVAVYDEGAGVPESEREIVLGERDITQLRHASGLGLWVAKWVADAYDGDLSFDEDAVRLRFRSR
ncbi:HAMP domain-containing sensor histidine kinase [Salarchaeum sp. III]|uniref:sensor histidine kinase n=1 Tax=Salarchaeum sp. III TaxID=3107927 RepID=UPI002ED91A70